MLNRSKFLLICTTRLLTFRLLLFISILLVLGCKSEPDTEPSPGEFHLKIRLASEPDRINPILSRQTQASQIEGMIFLPLADYNPRTLELEPVLIKEAPVVSSVTDRNEGKALKYEMEIMDEAAWENGDPVTGYDYAFTLKVAFNPFVINQSWHDNMRHIVDVEIDPDRPRNITVITDRTYILSEEVITTTEVYPEYIYDPDHLLKDISFFDLVKYKTGVNATLDSILHRFADQFNDQRYSNSVISGAGPYEFVEWIPNQQIVLKRKDNWWGLPFQNKHPSLEANPATITYYFIQDAQTAITALKDQRLDLVAEINPEQYTELKQYQDARHPIQLEAPSVLSYYFVAYNNDRPQLADRRVRKAISMLMDVDELIDQLFYGLAVRTIGPLSPQHLAYNRSLTPIQYDPSAAGNLLAEAGWVDSDQNGILEKNINGIKTEMKLIILTSQSQLGQDVALVLKSNAKDLGIDFEVVPVRTPQLLQDTEKGNYDLACLVSVQSIGAYDPYNFWHSDKAGPGGTNFLNFRNQEVDNLIDSLRTTLNSETRNKLYLDFQEIIYEEQPALFLVSPKTPIAANGNLFITSTPLRPGYFENTFQLKK